MINNIIHTNERVAKGGNWWQHC